MGERFWYLTVLAEGGGAPLNSDEGGAVLPSQARQLAQVNGCGGASVVEGFARKKKKWRR